VVCARAIRSSNTKLSDTPAHAHRKHQFTQPVTMSSNLPLRTIRIPALRQQCRLRHRTPLPTPRAFSTTTPQALGVTSPRLGRAGGSSNKLMISGAAKRAGQPSPEVLQNEAEQEGEMMEDIGLLQDTLVRARWRDLPPMWSPAFWGYWYKVLKSKISGLYS
jgi:protein MBA1